jgi:hypothetical protein
MYQKYLPFIKPTLWILGVSVGGFIAYNLITKGKRIGRQIKESSEFGKEQKEKLSYPKTQYKSWADSIEKSFYPTVFGIGTDEETIYSIIRKLKNNSDWLELQKAYGVRPYYQGGFKYDDYNLVESINIEDENAEMRNRINGILSTKKISYRI